MIRSLYTAATGMKANQLYVDNIANNLANVNTTGFKKSKIDFEDLLYQTLVEPGAGNADGARSPAGLQVGLGTRAVSNQKIFTQGNVSETGNSSDISISGKGFFQVALPDGEIAYTRDGSFKQSADGTLVTAEGYMLEPQIVIPEGAKDFTVSEMGQVLVRLQNDVTEEIGQLELGTFVNDAGLKALGKNLFAVTEASGPAEVGTPGQDGLGTVQGGYLETSNVQLVEEMVNMIVAQRAYEISSKAITTSDEMLQMANQLRG